MSDAISEKCGSCRWWDGRTHGENTPDHWAGNCRRHAPFMTLQVTLSTPRYRGQADREWPITEALDWCGDYETKPAEGQGETTS